MAMPNHSTDYARLRQEGIKYLEQLGGDVWTDYNAHDPGITILEQLCYAITDLGYRTSFDIPDLLAEGGSDGVGQLFRPSEVLTCQPVTLNDLRKLAMDVKGVKNAWVEPVEEHSPALHFHPGKNELSLKDEPPASEPVRIKGLYRVLIEKSELVDDDGEDVRRWVVARLHASRALCEDFDRIKLLRTQDVAVHARIDIGHVEDADAVLLEVFEKISNHISPRVPFQSLPDMLNSGKAIDEIFDGPALRHGFIDTADLDGLSRREAIHSSDIIREIMSVDGVRAVRSIRLVSDGKEADWVLAIAEDMAPALDPGGCSITFQRGQLEVAADLPKVINAYIKRQSKERMPDELSLSERDVVPPKGRDRKLARYHSVLHQFPQVYGIGAAGLPSSASRERKAQARQLKAYLMIFDQLLANLFAQLAHAKDLLSFHDQGARTYFSQMVEDPALGLDPIRAKDAEDHREKLEDITGKLAQRDDPSDRRNRFLNHLLARFAEHFTDYSLMLQGAQPADWGHPTAKLIDDKQAFLQRYPRVSAGRGAAFDYTRPPGPDNVSGLEERIRLKLGFVEDKGESFLLVEHILLRALPADAEQGTPFLAAARSKDPYSLQLSLVFPNRAGRFKKPGFRALVERTIREETPAHLTPHVHWLSSRAMGTFRQIHEDWMEKLREMGAR